MPRCEVTDLFASANNLFMKYYGNKVEIRVPIEDGRASSSIDIVERAYEHLSVPDKSKLEDLLETFVTVTIAGQEGRIKYRVDNVEEIDSVNRRIHLLDNCEGKTLNFIPTYGHALKLVRGLPIDDERMLGCKKGKIEKNRIVVDWHAHEAAVDYGYIIPPSAYEDEEGFVDSFPPRVWLFSPESHAEQNGISMISYSADGVKYGIDKLKQLLVERFIPHPQSPILLNIQKLLENGYDLSRKTMREERQKNEKIREEREFQDIVGKEF